VKIVVLGAALAALVGFRIWGAHRRRGGLQRGPALVRPRLGDRPATVRLLLAVALVTLVVVAYVSFSEVAS